MKRSIEISSDSQDDIFCMSDLRGKDIVVPHKMPFSFFFSEKGSDRAINVKPVFNPDKISKSSFGTLELHGSWKYTPEPDDRNVPKKLIIEMVQFFREYKVLFAGVWEGVLYDGAAIDYFRGIIDLPELLTEFDFYGEYKIEMNKLTTVADLDRFVRDNNLFNMWD